MVKPGIPGTALAPRPPPSPDEEGDKVFCRAFRTREGDTPTWRDELPVMNSLKSLEAS